MRVLMALIVMLGLAAPAAAETRLALVVGNGGYERTSWRLANPSRDADAMASVLIELGFSVEIVKDADRERLSNALSDFGRAVKRAGPDVVAFFYYAGHAAEHGGVNYLVPTSSSARTSDQLRFDSPALTFLLDDMGAAGNAVNVVVLDACRDMPLPDGTRLRAAGGQGGLARAEAPNVLIAYATEPGRTAEDGMGANSRFTAALVQKLRQEPEEPFSLLLEDIRIEVSAATAGAQRPLYTNGLGVPRFALKDAAPRRAPVVTPVLAADQFAFNKIAEDRPCEYALFAKAFPDSELASLAQARAGQTRPCGEAVAPSPKPEPATPETDPAPSQPAATAPGAPRVTSSTDERALVTQIQRGLSALGCRPGAADGLAGRTTRAAADVFADARGLAVSDLDARFLAAIQTASDAGFTCPPPPRATAGGRIDPLADHGDAPAVLWDRGIPGADKSQEYSNAVAADSMGGAYLVGWRQHSGGYRRILAARLDANGRTLWDQTFGDASTEDFDEGSGVTVLAGGDVLVAGTVRSMGAGWSDIFLARLTPEGRTVWTRTYGGGKTEQVNAVAALPDGGALVAGLRDYQDATKSDMLLLRVDAHGEPVWERRFGGPGDQYARDLAVLPDGGVILAGGEYPGPAGATDMLLVHLDPEGAILWERTFGGANDDQASGVAVYTDGGVVVVGSTWPGARIPPKIYIVRLDAEGGLLWEKDLGSGEGDYAEDVLASPDGGLLLVGDKWMGGEGLYNEIVAIRLDKDGATQWRRSFGGYNSDDGEAVDRAVDGSLFIAGHTQSLGDPFGDMRVIKLDETD